MKALQRVGRALALVAAFAVAAIAHAALPPRGADGLLAVPPPARVTDYAGVLSPQQKRALDDKLAAFEMAHGAQIAVLIVPSTQPEPIEDFAHRVGEAWKIGRAGIGDGVLVIVAKDDRRLRIDVARSLEGALPDVTARRIGREIMGPYFQRGDYAGGLSAGLDEIFRRIESEGLPAPREPPATGADADLLALLMPFVIGGFVVGVILRRIFGIPGSLLAAGGSGFAAAKVLASGALGALAGLAVFVLTVGGGSRAARVLGGRRGGVFIPGGWSGGGWSGGGGWTSGGGGDFSGGGATSDW
ncbi:MAG: TPM domain-containing protein [Burkholderiaceae bacterium]